MKKENEAIKKDDYPKAFTIESEKMSKQEIEEASKLFKEKLKKLGRI